MIFQTSDENDIKWLADPSGYAVEDVIQKIKDAGKWETFLSLQQDDETGAVDCDALYDYLRHESEEALREVGLHYNQATATVLEVVQAWAEANKGDGLKVSYCEDGKTPSGLQLYDYGASLGVYLEFESVDSDGEVEEISLDADDVLELMKHKANGNADTGAWTGIDVGTAVFEMWNER